MIEQFMVDWTGDVAFLTSAVTALQVDNASNGWCADVEQPWIIKALVSNQWFQLAGRYDTQENARKAMMVISDRLAVARQPN